MFKATTNEQTIALGGVFQACQLVDNLARNGSIPTDVFDVCLQALLNQNPESTEQVYGSLENLRIGFESMQELLTLQGKSQTSNVLRYVVAVVYLAKKLQRSPKVLDQVGNGIARASQQADIFGANHDNVIANLAQLYQDTLGTFRYRIQVNGYPDYLQQSHIAAKIRCLLFSAIRSTVLWNQLGGRRYHLIFCRKSILNHLHQLQRTV